MSEYSAEDLIRAADVVEDYNRRRGNETPDQPVRPSTLRRAAARVSRRGQAVGRDVTLQARQQDEIIG